MSCRPPHPVHLPRGEREPIGEGQTLEDGHYPPYFFSLSRLAGEGWGEGLSGESLPAAVPQQVTRRGVGTLAVLEGYLAVDHDPAIPVSILYPPPLASREVMHDHRLLGLEFQVLQIIHNHIRRRAFLQRAAVLEARALGRHPAQTIVCFFQTHEASVTHHPGDHVRRIRTNGDKLSVRATI